MSSLFDAPVHLVMILSAVVAGQEPAGPDARSARPDAEITYAFSDEVWLAALQQGFGGAGVERYRDRIFTTSGGRIYVPILSERQEILKARRRPAEAHAVAVDLAHYHFVELRRRLGQSPGVQELYAAHVFGIDVAASLPGLMHDKANVLVADAMPNAAAAFPEIASRKTTVADFYRRLPNGSAILAESAAMASALPVQASRMAPLRGVIADAESSTGAQRERLAKLDAPSPEWVTQILRAQ